MSFNPDMQPFPMNFPGPVGTKRRRMRSGGNVSSTTEHSGNDDDDEKVAQTSKCKGVTTIPIFLKKTYKMIESCNPDIASWTTDGEMFVVKDPDRFAEQVIPQYFDHNKFSSFARQLNFYGFRKMQSKPIKNVDYDAAAAKHVTFFNENFKRGRCDLLKNIQRSTRGGTGGSGQDAHKEIQQLRDKVSSLENEISDMKQETEERVRRLELDMLARLEQVLMAVNKQQQSSFNLQSISSIGSKNGDPNTSSSLPPNMPSQNGWNNSYGRETSTNSQASAIHQLDNTSIYQNLNGTNTSMAPPTLPPHPKQKQIPPTGFPSAIGAGPEHLQSLQLRGLSLARGLSGLSRGGSDASAVLGAEWGDAFVGFMESMDSQQQQQQQQQSAPTVSSGSV